MFFLGFALSLATTFVVICGLVGDWVILGAKVDCVTWKFSKEFNKSAFSNINTKTTNTNSEIISTLKNMGFSDMDDDTINALIDTCKSQKNVKEVSVQDILEFLT